MLIALALSFFMFSGGGSDAWPLKELIEIIGTVVTDETRADAAKNSAKEIANALDDFNGQYAESAKALKKVHKQYDADAGDYVTVFIPLQGNRRAMNHRLIDARTQLVSTLNKEEWEQIFKMENLDSKEE